MEGFGVGGIGWEGADGPVRWGYEEAGEWFAEMTDLRMHMG